MTSSVYLTLLILLLCFVLPHCNDMHAPCSVIYCIHVFISPACDFCSTKREVLLTRGEGVLFFPMIFTTRELRQPNLLTRSLDNHNFLITVKLV